MHTVETSETIIEIEVKNIRLFSHALLSFQWLTGSTWTTKTMMDSPTSIGSAMLHGNKNWLVAALIIGFMLLAYELFALLAVVCVWKHMKGWYNTVLHSIEMMQLMRASLELLH